MSDMNRSYLPLGLVLQSVFALSFLNFPLGSFAQDPIVVHYSDPSLTRMEAEIGVKAALKDRFEDIVVKYRDPLNSPNANDSTQGKSRSGHHSGGQGSTQYDQDEAGSSPRLIKGKVTRNELDELATILTPAQLKKFQDLNDEAAKKRHGS
jgi:hypothetical protein